jgi:NADH-quinone oxidoreductase subunit H
MMSEYFNLVFFDILKIMALLIPVLISVAMIVWVDRRVWGMVQLRRGPNVVGPFGLLQTGADAYKIYF